MCGIVGVVTELSPAKELTKTSLLNLNHRGPDESGFYFGKKCHLGIARLAIVDIVQGSQPVYNESKEIIAILNGEIYNFRKLRSYLESRGHTFRSDSDSEIIPHLYEEYGPDFFSHLVGMFAIAVWDSKSETLLLGRDRVGEKPLWYHISSNEISFASELKALSKLIKKLDFDESTLAEYFTVGYISAPRSPYKDVRQLEPGTYLKFEKGLAKTIKYWSPNFISSNFHNEIDLYQYTKALLIDSVRDCMFSERPIGAFLSGGIDSTLIVAIMKGFNEDVRTFSVGFEDKSFDESTYAKKIANYLKTNHNETILSPDPTFLVQEISKHIDQPFADSSILPTFLLCKFASEQIVVALSGDGGDEVFGGYRRYRANHYLNRINSFLPLQVDRFDFEYRDESTLFNKLKKNVFKSDLKTRYFSMQSMNSKNELSRFTKLNPSLDEFYSILSSIWQENSEFSPLQQMQVFDLEVYLPNDLMYKVDMSSMAHGLEVRSPFLNHKVIEWGLNLPTRHKISLFENKKILRRITEEFVPRELIDRPKKGFGIPRAEWLRNDLRQITEDTLLSRDAFSSKWFTRNSVVNLLKEHNNGRDLDRIIWPMLMLELWSREWL